FCYGDSVPDRPCCSLDSITDARLVAHKLGIPHYVLNFEDRFGRDVIATFVAEYASGRTPIPCVRCNSFTKFRDFLYHADALDCAYVATGHYAIARDGALFRGRDPRKDQSYFLWGIDRSVVARMLTPVGDLTKRETRAVARRLGLVTAEKVESVEICFVPDDDYVGVLERHLPADAPALTPGPLVTAGGDVVGEHAGFARYTIGQRRGLPGGFREPMYVVAIRPETREVVIGSGDELFGHTVTLAELNWLADALAPGDAVLVQCRYRAPAVPGRVREQVGGAPSPRRSRMPARHRSLLPYLAVATALLAAACGDNPLQPKKPADPLATAANIQALGTSFTSLPFQSFSFATTYVPTAASPMAALRPLLRAAQPTLVTRRALSLAESRLAATALRAALVPSSGAIAASIFPPGVVLGTTYTWNATTF